MILWVVFYLKQTKQLFKKQKICLKKKSWPFPYWLCLVPTQLLLLFVFANRILSLDQQSQCR